MCCLIPSDPVEDVKGKRRTFQGPNVFQTDMMHAPCVDCPTSGCWCIGQFIPWTCGIAQYMLRSKALNGDLSKYVCFQGIFDPWCCCIHPGDCGEQSCPALCLFLESCLCNSLALSATRVVVMERYDLQSDPCDYRLIRISNALQCLSFICDILAIIDRNFQQVAHILDLLADLMYHTVSGCMTAQVAHELNYQAANANNLAANPHIHDKAHHHHHQQNPYVIPETTHYPPSSEPTIYPATAEPTHYPAYDAKQAQAQPVHNASYV